MVFRIIKFPLRIQIKIWLIFWAVATALLMPVLILIIKVMGLERWAATPMWFKAAAISLPMVIIMPAIGEWATRKITIQEEKQRT